MNTEMQNEILKLKARLFELSELEKERDTVRSRLVFLLGKAEVYAEIEARLKDEMAKAEAEKGQKAGALN